MTAIQWLSAATAFEVNHTPRRESVESIPSGSSRPPSYVTILEEDLGTTAPPPLSPVVEQDERDEDTRVRAPPTAPSLSSSGNRVASTSNQPPVRAPIGPRDPAQPKVIRRNIGRDRQDENNEVASLIHELVAPPRELLVLGEDALRRVRTGQMRMGHPQNPQVQTDRGNFLDFLVNGIVSMVGSMRGVGRRRTPSSPAEASTVDLSEDFHAFRPAPSLSEPAPPPPRVHQSPQISAASSPCPPLKGASLQAASSAGPSSQPPANAHLEGVWTKMSSRKEWQEALRPSVAEEPRNQVFRLQRPNPVPLVFSATDGSGATATLDLHVADIAIINPNPRVYLVEGGFSALVSRIIDFAGSIIRNPF